MDKLKRFFSDKKDYEIYIVGGAVRDTLLGIEPKDIDVALGKNFYNIAEKFANFYGGSVFLMHDDVARVVLEDKTYDFCKFKGETLEEDLKRRDFTINAMAMDLSGNVIDVLGGRHDLESKIIKLAYDDALSDDPLRMLRAFRLRSKTDFKIDEAVLEFIKNNHNRINESSGERIIDEIFKILESNNSYKYLLELDDIGLLSEIFPVFEKMKLVGKCKYHTVDAFTHSMYAIKTFEDMIEDVFKTKHGDEIKSHLEEKLSGVKRLTVLKLATLLHDIGKPKAFRQEGDKITFKGHDATGFDEFKEIDNRYNFSKEQRDVCVSVIKGHMRILGLFKTGASDRALFRLIKDFGENILDVILASLFDVTATRRLLDNSNEKERYFSFCMELIDKYYKKKNVPTKLINGDDVIKLTGKKGKFVGEVLDAVQEETFLGNIKSRDDAIEYVKRLYK
ncbi:Multifunctional CCA protein [Caloramator mitchellensis]|uniref:Multifunctional CCA protein n=1 Tax=Caloramator mitchellensis TaxID=908809 RepID=A0A0R3JVK6_CALMK|nr:HDIG domain-containing metalloprotein [Caloramator mitchellensis]KRQ86333.1 Multifunctional CCA protein [Caloramator mitchellensis]